MQGTTRGKWAALFTIMLVFVSGWAQGKTLFEAFRDYRHSPLFVKRVGLEVELTNLNLDRVGTILQTQLNGELQEEHEDYAFVDPDDQQTHHYKSRYLVLRGPRGKFIAKPEDNVSSLAELSALQGTPRTVEIVAPPLLPDLTDFQAALDQMQAEGALGTSPQDAVALQVNVEIGGGVREKIFTQDVIQILANYLRPENRRAIANLLRVPPNRKKYVGYPAAGFMKRLLDPHYRPDWERLYMDAMYRSSLEQMADPEAWTCSDEEARARVMEFINTNGFEPLLPVFKWNFVRYSSLMMFMRPYEPLSRYLSQTGWFHAYPILEFREPNNDFSAQATTDWVLGFVAASQELGSFTPTTLDCVDSLEH